ncbi:hypothetical protein LTR94_028250, partial [Friedmanniomyces endolithicus]
RCGVRRHPGRCLGPFDQSLRRSGGAGDGGLGGRAGGGLRRHQGDRHHRGLDHDGRRDGARLSRGGLAAALVRRGAEGQDAPVQPLDQRGHHERHGDRQRPADPGPAVRRADRRDLGADAVPLRPVFGDAVEADDQAGLASAGRRRGGVLGLCGRGGGGRLHLAQRRLFRRDQPGLAVGSQATGTRAGRI